MSGFKLRPHHALCMQHFQGKGYSRDFTDNMYRIIEAVGADTEIEITDGADDLCACCPNLDGNDCKDCIKVSGYDSAVLRECGFEYGDIVYADVFFGTARGKIIDAGIMRDICGCCRWADICFGDVDKKVFWTR